MESRKKHKRKFKRTILTKLFCIVLIAASIVVLSKVGKNVYTAAKLKKQAQAIEQEMIALEDENATLISTRNKLEDPNYVTTYARGEYMFSKGDEKVFYLVGDEN